ncbi:MAG: hypothetical protein QM762_03130 [Chryseolinea sp.]
MSIVNENPLLEGASGKFARVVVYRRVRGKVVMAKRPTPSTEVSEKQVLVRKSFSKAAGYAKRQNAKPEVKRLYAEGLTAKKHNAFLVALSDYLKSPEITSVNLTSYTGAPGQTILIDASDDFRVAAVSVAILGADGVQIESGPAKAGEGLADAWIYVTTANNAAIAGTKVQVTATDFAGNVTVATFPK